MRAFISAVDPSVSDCLLVSVIRGKRRTALILKYPGTPAEQILTGPASPDSITTATAVDYSPDCPDCLRRRAGQGHIGVSREQRVPGALDASSSGGS